MFSGIRSFLWGSPAPATTTPTASPDGAPLTSTSDHVPMEADSSPSGFSTVDFPSTSSFSTSSVTNATIAAAVDDLSAMEINSVTSTDEEMGHGDDDDEWVVIEEDRPEVVKKRPTRLTKKKGRATRGSKVVFTPSPPLDNRLRDVCQEVQSYAKIVANGITSESSARPAGKTTRVDTPSKKTVKLAVKTENTTNVSSRKNEESNLTEEIINYISSQNSTHEILEDIPLKRSENPDLPEETWKVISSRRNGKFALMEDTLNNTLKEIEKLALPEEARKDSPIESEKPALAEITRENIASKETERPAKPETEKVTSSRKTGKPATAKDTEKNIPSKKKSGPTFENETRKAISSEKMEKTDVKKIINFPQEKMVGEKSNLRYENYISKSENMRKENQKKLTLFQAEVMRRREEESHVFGTPKTSTFREIGFINPNGIVARILEEQLNNISTLWGRTVSREMEQTAERKRLFGEVDNVEVSNVENNKKNKKETVDENLSEEQERLRKIADEKKLRQKEREAELAMLMAELRPAQTAYRQLDHMRLSRKALVKSNAARLTAGSGNGRLRRSDRLNPATCSRVSNNRNNNSSNH